MAKKSKGSSLKDRMKKSYESKDKGGGNRPQAFNWNKVKNIKFFKPVEDKRNTINIIPYPVSTENDPLVASGDIKVGDLSYMLDAYVHTYVGPTQAEVICLKSNFNKPCPICEQAKAFWDEGKKKEAKTLYPKRFCVYNIQDIKNPSEKLIWYVKHFNFEKEMIDEARNYSNDGDIVDFVDPEEGKSISFRWAKEETVIDGKATTYFKGKSFQFPDRDEPIDPSLIEGAVSLDGLMKVQTYKEIEKLLSLEEEDEEAEEEDEKPAKKSSKKKEVEEEEEDEEQDEDDAEEEDSEEEDEEAEEEDDEIEDPVEEEKPAKKTAKKSAKKEPEKASTKSSPKCPHKHTYGKDCDTTNDCEDCDEYFNCLKVFNSLKKKK
jgi:hypothetical protein